ncbi:MAG TPA: TlpA disulfide reductase family protein [Halomonas sp.]|nr:TlpA disulfide reductase family protein [Halomonas sp.]
MSLLHQSLAVGPIGLSVERWLLILAVVLALLAGALMGARRRVSVSDSLTTALLVGVVGARLLFVAQYHQRYDGLLAMLDIRDGGFAPLGGVIAAALYLAWRLWRSPKKRGPLAGAVLVGAFSWGLTAGSLMLIDHQAGSLPEVPMATLDGESTSLTGLAERTSQPLVVNLWATWCPPCRREMPLLESAQREHDDIAFVFANQGESSVHVRRFLDAETLNLDNVWLDPSLALGTQLGAQIMPTTLFFDADGRLIDSHIGELSRASLAPYLERLKR